MSEPKWVAEARALCMEVGLLGAGCARCAQGLSCARADRLAAALAHAAAAAPCGVRERLSILLARASRFGTDGLMVDVAAKATRRDIAWADGYNEALADFSRELRAAFDAAEAGVAGVAREVVAELQTRPHLEKIADPMTGSREHTRHFYRVDRHARPSGSAECAAIGGACASGAPRPRGGAW